MRAKSVVVVTGEYVEARDAVLYLGKVPVFTIALPPLPPAPPGYWVLEPGCTRGEWGPPLTSYSWFGISVSKA